VAHVIDLSDSRERRNALRAARAEAVEALEQLSERLFTAALNLAVADAWREWDEATPEGTVIELDPQALLECADPDVRALARLWVAAQETLEELEPERVLDVKDGS
jgi:hypothetical protein